MLYHDLSEISIDKMIGYLMLLIGSNLNSITRAEDINDYIRELPSEERNAYMSNVARRIVQEVEVKEKPNVTSFEIPDDMLAKSNEFVNKVMTEELKKIKTARKNKKNWRPLKNTRPQDREGKYINFTFRTDLHKDMTDHIDLTKRKSISPTDTVPVGEGDPKTVKKRDVLEVPVQVVYDKGSKRNERRSWDQEDDDDYDRKDDKELGEKQDRGISADTAETTQKDGNDKSLEPNESKQSEFGKKEAPEFAEETTTMKENRGASDTDTKLGKIFKSFTYAVDNEQNIDNDGIRSAEASTTMTGLPPLDGATSLADNRNGTFPWP